MPLCDNVPDGKLGWRMIPCPECGRMCWQRPEAAALIYHGGLDGALCTECALKAGNQESGGTITEQEAVEKGMDDISIALGILDGEIIPDPNKLTPNEKLHGKVVGTRMDPYHDVTIYEDGYEERYYIGD